MLRGTSSRNRQVSSPESHQHIVNLTQHIEDDNQRDITTRTVCIYLSVAHDTVNHRILIQKHYNTSTLGRLFQNMLFNQRL